MRTKRTKQLTLDLGLPPLPVCESVLMFQAMMDAFPTRELKKILAASAADPEVQREYREQEEARVQEAQEGEQEPMIVARRGEPKSKAMQHLSDDQYRRLYDRFEALLAQEDGSHRS